MATLKLKVSNKILDKVLWLLSQFKSEDLEIIQDDEFIADQKYAKSQLDRLESGKGNTYSIEQVDELLVGTIRQNES